MDWDIYLISMNPAPTRPVIEKLPNVKGCYQVAPEHIAESGRNYQYFFKWPQVRKLVREIDPDVITTIYLTSYGLMGRLVKGRAKLAHFVVGNDIMVFPNGGFLNRTITSAALSSSDLVISASDTMTDRLTRQFSYPTSNILTQQYGVADELVDYPVQDKIFDVICNRAWIPNSNVEYLLKLLKSVKTKSALIGDVVLGSEDMGRRIENEAKTAGVKILGILPYDRNIQSIASSRFMASLTTSDGASLSVMEAMALGTIPILSDTAPNREWVRHGENGFLLPLNDLRAAEKVFGEALAIDDATQGKMAAMNKDIIRERGLLKKNMKRASTRLLEIMA